MRLLLVLAAFWAAVSACSGRPAADNNGSGHAATPTTAAPGTATVTAARPSTHTPTPAPAASATHTPTPSATVRPSATPCAERRGRVSTLAVPSATLRYDIDARVYLPPCYAAYQKYGVTEAEFEGPKYQRLAHIKKLIETKVINEDLRFLAPQALAA